MPRYQGMTWVEFKEWMEEQGVQDDDYLEYLHTTLYKPEVVRVQGDDGLWYVSVN